MKLRPPEVKIDPADPFKEALFGRKGFAESMTRLLQRTTDSPVIFVNAPWGEGKTTFARRWLALLEQQKLKAIYFDAYAADYAGDPFVSFTGEILRLIKEQFPHAAGVNKRAKEFKKTAIEVGKRLGGLSAKLALSTLTRGAVGLADIKKLTDASSEIADGLSAMGSEFVEKKIEEYGEEKDALKVFRDSLEKLALAVREEQKFPLTIIVDELDRCRPDFALGLLERIKHLFEVENVAFVLLVNQEQIESCVRTVYGVEGDQARSYLLKFATLFVDLPKQSVAGLYLTGHVEYGRELTEHFSLPNSAGLDRWQMGDYIGGLSRHLGLTLREMEKAFVVLALYLSTDSNPSFTLAAFLSVLKIKRPDLYRRLKMGTVELRDFLTETDIAKLAAKSVGGINYEFVFELFRFCLISGAEFSALPEDERRRLTGRRRSEGRDEIIPELCAALDRFSVQPSPA